ncbi:MAG: type II secretion system protein GspG [Candidatus Eremiobacteraeota bacterium]|nr:type II secretion system protein GspG [Candidatus Eremiobacteraeota bacterium]
MPLFALSIARAQSAPVASGTGNALLAGFVGALLGELLGRTIIRRAAQQELAAEQELRRERLTEDDEARLKMIATALEEFSVDNGGAYPATLADLKPPYLNEGSKLIPGTDPEDRYVYERPSPVPGGGAYDIRDDGRFDPTLDKLHNAIDHTLCTHATCRYIIYLQSGGLYGI